MSNGVVLMAVAVAFVVAAVVVVSLGGRWRGRLKALGAEIEVDAHGKRPVAPPSAGKAEGKDLRARKGSVTVSGPGGASGERIDAAEDITITAHDQSDGDDPKA